MDGVDVYRVGQGLVSSDVEDLRCFTWGRFHHLEMRIVWLGLFVGCAREGLLSDAVAKGLAM